MRMKNAGFTAALRVCNALLLIVLVVTVLFLELPQGVGWIHKPTVLTIALPGIVLIHLATRPKRHELFIGAVLAVGLFVSSVSACRNSLELLLAGGGSLGFASLLALGINRIARAEKLEKPHPFSA